MIGLLNDAPWMLCAVPVAWWVDRAWGEPARWHPVVGMGRCLNALGAPWPQARPARAMLSGALAWGLVAAGWVALGGGLELGLRALAGEAAGWRQGLAALLLGLVLKPMLAWRMLRDEVAGVGQALAEGLPAGRERLSRLVSRDTRNLDAVEVRESALESLAENLNDAWVAPLFWFAVAGLPGAVLYRFANTADAMWGYRGRWEWAGKWAARADDVLSWVPARLTAVLLALAAGRWPRGLAAEAARTPSPNGGWPMGTLALLLDVRLAKPGVYVLHAAGRDASDALMAQALRLCGRAVGLSVAALGAAGLGMVIARGPWTP